MRQSAAEQHSLLLLCQFLILLENQVVQFPFGQISYFEAQGSDLLTNPEEVWDIEIIEFEVAPEVDLHHIATQLDDLGLAYYVDKKGKILTLTDGQNLEIWFME